MQGRVRGSAPRGPCTAIPRPAEWVDSAPGPAAEPGSRPAPPTVAHSAWPAAAAADEWGRRGEHSDRSLLTCPRRSGSRENPYLPNGHPSARYHPRIGGRAGHSHESWAIVAYLMANYGTADRRTIAVEVLNISPLHDAASSRLDHHERTETTSTASALPLVRNVATDHDPHRHPSSEECGAVP